MMGVFLIAFVVCRANASLVATYLLSPILQLALISETIVTN